MSVIFGLFPSGFRENIYGSTDDDTIHPLGGWDFVDGRGGVDTVVVQAPSTSFKLTSGDGVVYLDTLSAASASAEQVILKDVEFVRFTDTTVSLALPDTFYGQPGSDFWDGGGGLDRVVYAGALADHSIARDGARWVVRDLRGDGGTDSLMRIERLEFGDAKVALDVSAGDAAGQAVLLIGAVLGRELVREKQDLMGSVIELFDAGYDLPTLAGALMRLPIWDVLAGSDSSADVAAYLHQRVYGQPPGASELAAAVSALDHGAQGAYLAALAMSQANQLQVDLVGLAETGFVYL